MEYEELKRRYELRETLIKAKASEAQAARKECETLRQKIEDYRSSLNWIQRFAVWLFRLDINDL